MGFFGKKDKVVDLRGNYKIPERTVKVSEKKNSNSDMSAFGFGNSARDLACSAPSSPPRNRSSSENSNDEYVTWNSDKGGLNSDDGEKKTKLAKRLLDMTDKLEDLSNQIYHLKQRIDIIEKKLKISYD
jgi:hypothetical protein